VKYAKLDNCKKYLKRQNCFR